MRKSPTKNSKRPRDKHILRESMITSNQKTSENSGENQVMKAYGSLCVYRNQ